MENSKLLSVFGAGLWILGLVLTIIGLNLHSSAGTWLTVIGSASFLAGLLAEGVIWFRKRR